jgi:hypothetical protein
MNDINMERGIEFQKKIFDVVEEQVAQERKLVMMIAEMHIFVEILDLNKIDKKIKSYKDEKIENKIMGT